MRVTESGAIVARLLVPRLALDRRPDCRGALVPMGLALGPPGARRDIGEPGAARPAHHRRIGVDKLAGAEFPPSRVGVIVFLPRPPPRAFPAFQIPPLRHWRSVRFGQGWCVLVDSRWSFRIT